MEPVTHILTGACLARSGLNRRAAYATAAMAIAAEFPDIDTLWGLRGSIAGFEHHRGLTHTFLGIPFEAVLLLLGFVLFHRVRVRRSPHPPSDPHRPPSRLALSQAPVHWGTLYLLLLFALLSHLLLDYTNNYGLRPFFPFNPHWYAASIVFIFDPLLFLLLLAGLLLPTLFGLVSREVAGRRETFPGRGWARFALAGVLLLWAVRAFEHQKAVTLAQSQTIRAPAAAGIPDLAASLAEPSQPQTGAPSPAAPQARPLLLAQRSLASPDPLSVFRWYTVTDFGPAYQLGTADTRLATLVPGAMLVKPQPSALLLGAERSRLGRAYLDWSPMPIVNITAGAPDDLDLPPSTAAGSSTVTFTDPRFLGDSPFLQRRGPPPLAGTVVLSPANAVLAQGMNGRLER